MLVPFPLQLQHLLPQQEHAIRDQVHSGSAVHDLERVVLPLPQAGAPLQPLRRVRADARRRVGNGERAPPPRRRHEEMGLVHRRSSGDSHEMPQIIIQE